MHTDFDQSANFNNLKTYAWTNRSAGKGNRIVKNKEVLSRIQSAIDRELELKGYQKVSKKADFLVAQKVSEKLVFYASHGQTARRYGDRTSDGMRQGSLTVDILDPSTGNRIWQGLAKVVVDLKDDAETKEMRVNKTVKKLLQDFPPH